MTTAVSVITTNYNVKLNRKSRFLLDPIYCNTTRSHVKRSPNRSIINPFIIIHLYPTDVLNNCPNHPAEQKGPIKTRISSYTIAFMKTDNSLKI